MDRNNIKKIGIDARFYGPLGKGLGRYTQEIVDNIIKIDPDNKYVIFLSRDNFDELVIDAADSSRIKKVLAPVRWYTLSEQIILPWLIWREHLDLMHFPHFNVPFFTPVRFVVTIHDLILTKFPTVRATTLHPFLYKIKNLFYRLVILAALRRSIKIITVSDFTKNDIIAQFKIKPDKIKVTYEGVANLSKGNDSLFVKKLGELETLQKLKIKDDFLLYIGNAYPHKNLEGLVKVFAKINKVHPNLKLVLVGKEDYFYKRVKATAVACNLYKDGDIFSSVVFPGYVPDMELEILFKKALAYVFPSLYEGFGLPPLEAMARGCPVISSNKSSMPEILGEAAYYFNPEDENDMYSKIDEVITDHDLRQSLIKKGKERVKKYNWAECAMDTLKIYFSSLV